jgi:hypothetical protein
MHLTNNLYKVIEFASPRTTAKSITNTDNESIGRVQVAKPKPGNGFSASKEVRPSRTKCGRGFALGRNPKRASLLPQNVDFTVESVAVFVSGFGDITIEQQVAVLPQTAARVGDTHTELAAVVSFFRTRVDHGN